MGEGRGEEKEEERRGREIGWLVTRLHKDLSLILEPKVKFSVVVAYMYNPSHGEVKTGEPADLLGELEANKRPC